jgi:hypothetical protein
VRNLAQELTDAAVKSGKTLVDEYEITGESNTVSLYKNGALLSVHASIGTAMLWLDRNARNGDRVTANLQYTIDKG